MNKTAAIILRIDPKTKDEFKRIVASEGREVSDVILASIKDIVQKGQIPYNLYPLMKPRKNDVLTIAMIKKVITEAIATKFGEKVSRAYLFGSYSRGEETEESDVDIHVIPINDCSLSDIVELREDLEKAFHRSVDVVVGERLSPEFLANMEKDQILLYEKR